MDEPEGELLSVIFDRERPGSLAATLALLQRVASNVRDRISADMWRTLSHLMVDLMADLAAMVQPSDLGAVCLGYAPGRMRAWPSPTWVCSPWLSACEYGARVTCCLRWEPILTTTR